jgi:hypothetical protein
MIRALAPIPALYRGFPRHPDDEDDPYVFRLDLAEVGMSTARVVFGRDVASEGRPSTQISEDSWCERLTSRRSAFTTFVTDGRASLCGPVCTRRSWRRSSSTRLLS